MFHHEVRGALESIQGRWILWYIQSLGLFDVFGELFLCSPSQRDNEARQFSQGRNCMEGKSREGVQFSCWSTNCLDYLASLVTCKRKTRIHEDTRVHGGSKNVKVSYSC
uniref:Uncharacterized protein n=1 Tax=Arundo donax TaxID=35708 RepID=A0A0A8ZQG4_ARUDO